MTTKINISELLGNQSKLDNQLQKRMRLHQSWWRAFVLDEEPGQHTIKPNGTVGSNIKNGNERFKIITFANLIESLQKLNLDWETLEWSMMLWARYCGTELSKKSIE